MRAIGLFNPLVTIPSGDDFPQGSLATEATLQGSQIVHRECRCQLVEDRVIATVSLTFICGIHILALQDLAKGLDLLPETVVGHHQRKVYRGFRLFSGER